MMLAPADSLGHGVSPSANRVIASRGQAGCYVIFEEVIMASKKTPMFQFQFTFIVSRGMNEVFDTTIFANNEEMARTKLEKAIQSDFKARLRDIQEIYNN